MGKRIIKSFVTYICEKVIGWGLGQKLTMIDKLLQSFDIEQSRESKHVVREDEPLI